MKPLLMILLLSVTQQNPSAVIFDFKSSEDLSNWFIVDDGVMGGLSQGNIKKNDDGNALYSGYVTTENNGGFSSVRYSFPQRDVSSFTHVVLKLKGDGKAYQFRIKDDRNRQFSYIATFETTGEWETIQIPLKDFYPGFRGYKLNRPNYSGTKMAEIAILIGNKVKEDFALEIESISLK